MTLPKISLLVYSCKTFFLNNIFSKNDEETKLYTVLSSTAPKVSKCGVFSGTYFPVFGLNTEIYGVYGKIRTRQISVSGQFSRSEEYAVLSLLNFLLVIDSAVFSIII